MASVKLRTVDQWPGHDVVGVEVAEDRVVRSLHLELSDKRACSDLVLLRERVMSLRPDHSVLEDTRCSDRDVATGWLGKLIPLQQVDHGGLDGLREDVA